MEIKVRKRRPGQILGLYEKTTAWMGTSKREGRKVGLEEKPDDQAQPKNPGTTAGIREELYKELFDPGKWEFGGVIGGFRVRTK